MASDSGATAKVDPHPAAKSAPGNWLDLVGPIGSLDSLPPPETKRWVIRRKAEGVAAGRAGIFSLEEGCRRYTLSIQEFLSWQRLIGRHGFPGIAVPRLQDFP